MAGKYQTFFPAILEFKEFVIFFFVHCKTRGVKMVHIVSFTTPYSYKYLI